MATRTSILWFLAFAWIGRQTLLIRGRQDFSSVDDYAAAQIFIVFAALLVLLTGRPGVTDTIAAVRGRPARTLLAYYVFAAVSALWSPTGAYSLYMAVEALVLIVLTLAIASTAPSAARGERTFLFAVATIMVALYAPRAIARGIILVHTNQYSACALILFCYAFAEYHNSWGSRRRWLSVFGGAGLLGLGLGTSTGSNVATMVGIGAVALVRADLRRRVALMVLCLGIVAFLAGLSVQGVGDVLAPGKGWEGVATAQNRMPLWQVIIGGVKERPLLGWGFGVGAKTYSVAELNQYVLGAHNLLLEVLLNTGAVGLGIFLVAVAHLLFAVYREALRAQPGSAGVFAATVGALVNGLSGVPVCGTVWVPVAFAFFFMYGFFEFSIRGTGRYMPAEQLPLGARRQYGYGMRARTST